MACAHVEIAVAGILSDRLAGSCTRSASGTAKGEVRVRPYQQSLAKLIEVAPGPVAPGLDQFTLIFRGTPGAELDEAIHRLRPEGGNTLELFLAPAGEDGQGFFVAAAFSMTTLPGARGCAGATVA